MIHSFPPALPRCLLAVIICLVTGCGDQAPPLLQGETMGTTWSLQIADRIPPSKARDIAALIRHELYALEEEISHWKKDSSLSRWNQSSSTGWETVPPSLAAMVAISQKISRETGGALDVTSAPLIQLWGFGPHPNHAPLPTDEDINAALKLVGSHLLQVKNPPALKKELAGMQINVASVAEGYALDNLSQIVKAEGLKNFLLEIGGEVVAVGNAADGGPWQVGIQAPDGEPGETLERIPLTDACIATSGSYRHRFEKEGRTYSHLIDPRTGRPIEHKLVSVSVIHPRCLLADGYATALMVLGPEEGRKVAQRLGLRVIWLEEP